MNKAIFNGIGVLLLTCFGTSIAFADNNLPPVEHFFNDPEIQFASISPSGKYVATIINVEHQQAVAVREASDPSHATVVAHDNEGRMFNVIWVNDDRLLVEYHGERHSEYTGNVDLYAIDRASGATRMLINGQWTHHQDSTGSNVKDKTLGPEYNFYAVTHDGSDDIIVEKLHYNNIDWYADGSSLFRLNSRTGTLKELIPGKIPRNTRYWLLDKNDKPRIAFNQIDGMCGIYKYEAEEWKELDRQNCYEHRLAPVFFESDDSILAAVDSNGYRALARYNLKTAKYDGAPILQIKGFDYHGTLEVEHDTGKLIGVHYKTDAKATYWFDPAMAALQKSIDQRLPSTINTITCGNRCAGSPAFLIRTDSDRQPTQYVVYVPSTDKFFGIGGSHMSIKTAEMGLRDFYTYKASDGRMIPMYVTTPPGKLPKPYPTVVLIHGGPIARDADWEWEQEAQFLATRGYLVLQPEFRGTMGYGYDHMEAGYKQWGLAMQQDIADAAKWAIDKGWADPHRVGLMGGSYGGYATLMGLIKNPELFRCGVEFAGVTDLQLMFTSPVSDMTGETVKFDLPEILGDPVADAAKLKDNSPVNHADKLTQPLLMAAGGIDSRVPIEHATKFRNAVEEHNKQVEWVAYNEEGHGFYYEKNRIDFYRRVEKFFDTNLKQAKN